MDVFCAWTRLWYELECLDAAVLVAAGGLAGLSSFKNLQRDHNPVRQKRIKIKGRPFRKLAHLTADSCGVVVCHDPDPRFAVVYGTELGMDLWTLYWQNHFVHCTRAERGSLEQEVATSPNNLPKAERAARAARERRGDVLALVDARGGHRFF